MCTGVLLSIPLGLFFFFRRKAPPLPVQCILGFSAFLMSVVWLNLLANEIVSVLEAFGLAFDIESGTILTRGLMTLCMYSFTAFLGLTVLAIGNSVADWVADSAVARSGEPGMAVASCFGAPLVANVIGMSVALIVST